MSCYFCSYTNISEMKICDRCKAVLPGEQDIERITVHHGDDNWKIASLVHEGRVKMFDDLLETTDEDDEDDEDQDKKKGDKKKQDKGKRGGKKHDKKKQDKEKQDKKLSCMVVQIEFYGIKCLIVLGKENGKDNVRVSAARNIVSSNPQDSVKSAKLELPL